MGTRLHAHWAARFEGMSRRDREGLGCDYDAYLPDPLVGWDLTIPADVAADIADAESAVRWLNDAGTTHVSLEGLARFLLRAESVASSKIEGLAVAPHRLVSAEVALAQGGDAADRVAVEVLGNIDAMQSAVELAVTADPFGLTDLLSIHRTLMERSPTVQLGGQVRREQNWIGGSSYNPCSAAFVPPPHEYVPGLLDDLLAYVNGDDHSPLVQAALAHAQFETIHPFADGNGRTGRALVHVVLRRRGLAPAFVPPVSLVLATWFDTYIGGLTSFRHLADPDSPERSATAAEWLGVLGIEPRQSRADIRFVRYWLEHLRPGLAALTRSNTQDNLNAEQVSNFPFPARAIGEQRAIADFLDTETARIDALIAKRARMVDLLAEWLEAARAEVLSICEVTRPLLHLTDSLRPIMYGIVLPGPNVEDGVPIVKGGDVASGLQRVEDLCRTTREIERGYARSRLRTGDLVFAIRGGIGDVAEVAAEVAGANITQDVARVSPASGVDRRWLYHVLRSAIVQSHAQARTTGATIRGLNIWDLKRLSVPFAVPAEQTRMARKLDELEERSRAGRDLLTRQVQRLSEHRQALITAAVTGELDIPGVAA